MKRLRVPGTALTGRETEVLALVADGLSNQAIGNRLHLTEGTVKSHLARVYTKLGVDSRTAAAATDLGLIRRCPKGVQGPDAAERMLRSPSDSVVRSRRRSRP